MDGMGKVGDEERVEVVGDGEMRKVTEEAAHDANGEETDGVEGDAGNVKVLGDGGRPEEVSVGDDGVRAVETEETVVVVDGEKRGGVDFGSVGKRDGSEVLSAGREVDGGGREWVEESADGEAGGGGGVDGRRDKGGVGRGDEDGGVDAAGGEETGNVDHGDHVAGGEVRDEEDAERAGVWVAVCGHCSSTPEIDQRRR